MEARDAQVKLILNSRQEVIGSKIAAETVIIWSKNPVWSALESKQGMGRPREFALQYLQLFLINSCSKLKSNLAHPALKSKL